MYHNKEEIEKFLSGLGYKWLYKYRYKTVKDKVILEDQEGYRYVIRLCMLYDGFKPSFVNQANSYSIYNIKRYLKKNEINMKLVSDLFIGHSNKLEFLCLHCKKSYFMNWASIKKGARCCRIIDRTPIEKNDVKKSLRPRSRRLKD